METLEMNVPYFEDLKSHAEAGIQKGLSDVNAGSAFEATLQNMIAMKERIKSRM